MLRIVNPLLESGADPWLTEYGGRWYFMCTCRDRLELLCAESPAALAGASARIVFTPPTAGPGSRELWAPELHRLDGRWIIYYAASDGTHDAGRRMHAVVCSGDDPMKSEWSHLGMLNTVGIAVAMENAADNVKAAADFVTSTTEEAGITIEDGEQ